MLGSWQIVQVVCLGTIISHLHWEVTNMQNFTEWFAILKQIMASPVSRQTCLLPCQLISTCLNLTHPILLTLGLIIQNDALHLDP